MPLAAIPAEAPDSCPICGLLHFVDGVTILQLVLMPIFRNVMSDTSLTYTAFQALPIGHEPDGSQYFIFIMKLDRYARMAPAAALPIFSLYR
jgi:hypothetical protein